MLMLALTTATKDRIAVLLLTCWVVYLLAGVTLTACVFANGSVSPYVKWKASDPGPGVKAPWWLIFVVSALTWPTAVRFGPRDED